jgi:hypothetical protein
LFSLPIERHALQSTERLQWIGDGSNVVLPALGGSIDPGIGESLARWVRDIRKFDAECGGGNAETNEAVLEREPLGIAETQSSRRARRHIYADAAIIRGTKKDPRGQPRVGVQDANSAGVAKVEPGRSTRVHANGTIIRGPEQQLSAGSAAAPKQSQTNGIAFDKAGQHRVDADAAVIRWAEEYPTSSTASASATPEKSQTDWIAFNKAGQHWVDADAAIVGGAKKKPRRSGDRIGVQNSNPRRIAKGKPRRSSGGIDADGAVIRWAEQQSTSRSTRSRPDEAQTNRITLHQSG